MIVSPYKKIRYQATFYNFGISKPEMGLIWVVGEFAAVGRLNYLVP